MFSGQGMGGSFGGLGDIFSSLFGNRGKPYEDAQKQYQKYFNMATNAQNPFMQAGMGGLGGLQQWLSGMQDPTAFINKTMGQYQESPYAKYQQQQAINAANNIGSASGLLGSTPLMQQAQQNARDISSQDQNQWLQNVLGVNTQYGAGQAGLAGMGQNAANMLSQLFGQGAGDMSKFAWNRSQADQQRWPMFFNGLSNLFGL